MTLRTVVISSLLFWAPLAASAQNTDTSSGFDTSAEVDVNAEAEMNADGSGGATATGTGSGGATGQGQFDPGPNRTAHSQEGAADGGTLGIGADGMLSGLAGIQGRYQVTDTIGLQLALRFSVAALAQTDIGFGAGLSGIFTVFGFEGGHLALVGSVDFQLTDTSLGGPIGGSVTVWNMGIGAGIFAEIFPAEFFSIHGQAGARIAFGDTAGTNTFVLGIGGDLLAGFGFTFWFV